MSWGFRGGKGCRPAVWGSLAMLVTACAVQPQPFTDSELRAQAAADRRAMFTAEDPVTRPMTLAEAIARALKHNLDHRTKVMEEALAAGQRDVDRWDLLPKLAANAGFSARSEVNATRSRTLYTGVMSTAEPTYSQERSFFTADLGLSWNVLDFGLSYFNAHQNADRTLIATERRRKTVHNLVQEVRFAFWRTAAAQVLADEVTQAIALADRALADARRVEQEGLRAPEESLRYQKTLLETLRQLEAINHELATAKVELAALVNLPPGSELRLTVPDDAAMRLPALSLSLDQMEELAFVNNPDLREAAYQSRIAVDETRKAIVRTLPGLTLSGSRQYDSNIYAINHHWWQASTLLSWNLVNLLSAPDRFDAAEVGEKVTEARRLALRMAVLSQVHIAWRQFVNAGRQFERADDLHGVERRLARLTTLRSENDAQSALDRIASQTGAIAAQLRRYQTYAQTESALGRIYATLGMDFLPETVAAHDLGTLQATVERSLETWARGEVPVRLQAAAAAPAEPIELTNPTEPAEPAGGTSGGR